MLTAFAYFRFQPSRKEQFYSNAYSVAKMPQAYCLKQWISTCDRDTQRDREPFWRGREQIFYAHRCITFALFEF